MSVTKGLLAATLLLAKSSAVIAVGNDVTTCIADANARYCLKYTDLQTSSCCDSTVDCSGGESATCPAGCVWAETQAPKLCTTNANKVNNRFMRQALIPADSNKCPNSQSNQMTITTSGDAGRKFLISQQNGHTLDSQMPASNGRDWRCKLLLKQTITTPGPYGTGNDGLGYLYFTPEQYCFGKQVNVIVQPNNAYLDFNPQYETDNPAEMVKLFVSKFGTRYLVPAEYDVIIEFSPVGDDPNLNPEAQAACNRGTFKFWAKHVSDDEAAALIQSTAKPYANDAGANDDTKNIMLKDIINYSARLAIASSYTTANGITTYNEDATEEELIAIFANDDKLPKQSISSEGGTPGWYTTIYNEKVLFKVGDTEITTAQAFWASTGLLIIILVCVAICMAISFWKRKRIAAEARRASNYVRRSTATLRASIRKARGKPTPEEESKPMTDGEINKAASAGGETKEEKAMLKDIMKAQNDDEANEGGFIEMPYQIVNSNKVANTNC